MEPARRCWISGAVNREFQNEVKDASFAMKATNDTPFQPQLERCKSVARNGESSGELILGGAERMHV